MQWPSRKNLVTHHYQSMLTVISIAVKTHIPFKKQLGKKAIHRIAMTRENVLKECELYEKSEDEKLG